MVAIVKEKFEAVFKNPFKSISNLTKYEYDALNRLIKVLKKDDPDFTVGEYGFDALNRRIWRKADEDQDGSTDVDLIYIYDNLQVVEERDYSDEGLLRDYWYGDYIDEPIFGRADTNDDGDFLDTGEKFYYIHNTQYSVHALLDTSGDIIEVYKQYTPYGKVTVYTGDGGDGDWWDEDETTGNLTGNYYLFTGRRYDPESELHYFRARMWSAERGRFISRDPLGYIDGLNLYEGYFVPNSIDPFGFEEGEEFYDPFVSKIVIEEPAPTVEKNVSRKSKAKAEYLERETLGLQRKIKEVCKTKEMPKPLTPEEKEALCEALKMEKEEELIGVIPKASKEREEEYGEEYAEEAPPKQPYWIKLRFLPGSWEKYINEGLMERAKEYVKEEEESIEPKEKYKDGDGIGPTWEF